MSCGIGIGASHYAGCACHEARWAERLAAAHGHADSLRRGAISWRERAWKAEAETKEDLEEKLAASEARAEKAISDTVQEFGLRRAAEARVKALEGALLDIRDARVPTKAMRYDGRYTTWAAAHAAAALAPPPEAACIHEWTTDGCHANVFCRKCYVSAPPEAAKKGGPNAK